MKNFLLFLFLLSYSFVSFCQDNDSYCKRIVSRRSIQRKYGEWLTKRQELSEAINNFSKLNLTDENKSQIKKFLELYNSNVTQLSAVIDSVIEKLRTNDVEYVIQGISLTNEYRSKFSPPLKSLDSLRQTMIVYYNSIAPEDKRVRAFGGIGCLIDIIEAVLPIIIREFVVPTQIRKMECLRWKKWEI